MLCHNILIDWTTKEVAENFIFFSINQNYLKITCNNSEAKFSNSGITVEDTQIELGIIDNKVIINSRNSELAKQESIINDLPKYNRTSGNLVSTIFMHA